MSAKKVVITGGPGTGKTSVIKSLEKQGFICLPEISRQVTLDARKNGIEQLFLTEPLLFSEKLLEGRVLQFHQATSHTSNLVFLDRGLPDVLAYMNYIGDSYPKSFVETCKKHVYDVVFILPPWEEIYTSDTERYENFEQAIRIHEHLHNTYEQFGYDLTHVPKGSVKQRVDFILNTLSLE